MKCYSCGLIVSASASRCPYCGARLKKRTPFLGKLILIVVAATVLFPSLLGVLFRGAGSSLLPLCLIAVAAMLLVGGKKK